MEGGAGSSVPVPNVNSSSSHLSIVASTANGPMTYSGIPYRTDLMDLTEEMLTGIAEKVCGSRVITYDEQQIDFGKWTRLSMTAVPVVGAFKSDGSRMLEYTQWPTWAVDP